MRAPASGGPARAIASALVTAVVVSTLWLRFGDAPADPKKLATTDLANYYYGVTDLVGRRLAAGELPLWDPASCSGIPVLASLQPAVFHPQSWLAAWLPTADALFFGLWAQIVLAAVAACAALRAGGCHWAPSVLGGAVYAQGCLFANVAWPPSVSAMAVFPWLWLCVEKLASAPAWRWWLGLAGGTALQLFAGFPQYLVYGFYWLVPYATVRLLESGRSSDVVRARLATRGLWMLAAVVLGVGLAGVQLLPTLELARQSAREGGLSVEEIHYLGAMTGDAVQVLRNAVDPAPRNPSFALGTGCGYVGMLGLLAMAAGLVRPRQRWSTAFAVVAGAIALLLSDGFLGAGGWLYRIYHTLPTGDLFRTPERLRFVYMVALVLLSARGFDALIRVAGHRESQSWRSVLPVLGVVAAVVATIGAPGAGWRVGVALLLSAALLFAGRLGSSPSNALRESLATVCLAFALLDIFLATAPANPLRHYPTEVSESYAKHGVFATIPGPMLARLKEGEEAGLGRVAARSYLPTRAAGPAYGVHRPICYGPLVPGQWRALHDRLEPRRRKTAALANPDPERSAAFYDVASVDRFIQTKEGRPRIRPNQDALPRAYLVEEAVVAPQDAAFRRIALGRFDFARAVLLERSVAGSGAEPPASPGDARAISDLPPARIIHYEPERVVVHVAPERPAWLVLTDTFLAGWHAAVDGESAEILRANGLYRAVRVPADARQVVFEYRPASLRVGAAVSAASAIAMAGAAGFGARARRSRP